MKLASLLFGLSCLGLLGCSRQEPSPVPVAAPVAEPIAATLAPAAKPASAAASIYELRVALLDETGTVRTLDSFRGHPVLITMFYGTCPVACPLLTSELKRLEREIPEPLRSDVRILMVSFDAARDTPAALTRLEQERGLEPARWTLASANDDDSRELAAVLGIKYRKLDDGAFFHSSVIVLLDRQGRPQARLDGLNDRSGAILGALAAPSI